MTAEGWAIVQDGQIDMRTISPTTRAAMANWLVVTAVVMVTESWTDRMIEMSWSRHCSKHRAKLCRVRVEALED